MIVDRDQNLWNLWWVRYALLHLRNPFVTDMIWYPTPVSLYYHTLNIFNGLIAVPLLSFLSLTTTYNLILLFSFAMAGYGAFLLVYYLCRNRWAALVGSVVFAYSAYHISTMRGLLQLISLEWVPFFVLFLLIAVNERTWDTPRAFARWLLLRALPAGFALLLVSLVDWYYTMYALMLAGFIALYFVVRGAWLGRDRADRSRLWEWGVQPAVGVALCVAVYAVLISPVLVPMLRELRSTNYMQPAANAALANSADLAAFFEPSRDNKLLGNALNNRRDWPFGANRYEVYATYTALLLAGIGLFVRPRRRSAPGDPEISGAQEEAAPLPLPGKWFWAIAGIVFFLLALGPVLQINGHEVRWLFSPNLQLWMPYRLVEGLPLLSISRSPDRFDMPFTLCLAILAGRGMNTLQARLFPGLSARSRGAVLSGVVLALLLVELWPMPYTQRPADIPAWYYQLGKEPGNFSILELPPQDDFWHGAFRMYFQTAHEKPIFGGYISREFDHPFLSSTPGYQELTSAGGEGDMFADGPDQWYSALEQYGTKYIVLQKVRLPDHKDPPQDVTPSVEAIKKVLGSAATPVYTDSQLEVYQVPAPGNRVPFLSVGDGWQPREKNPQGLTYRWMGNEATMRIDAPRDERVNLAFRASSLGAPRLLQIFQGDTPVLEEMVPTGLKEFATSRPVQLKKGVNELRLVSPQGTTSPAALGQGDDPRQLSFVVLDARLQPSE